MKERLTLYSLPVTMLDTKEDIAKEIARKLTKAISLDDGQRFFKTEMIIKLLAKQGNKLHNASS